MKIYHSYWSLKNISESELNFFKVSAFLAKQNYGNINLITDDHGATQLKNIGYDSIDTGLNNLIKNKYIWSAGKLLAYKIIAEKKEHFIHIDHDVFLWRKMPEQFVNSRIFSQHEEKDAYVNYQIDTFKKAIEECKMNGDLFFNEKTNVLFAPNVGIFGGTDFETIKIYAEYALKFAYEKDNLSFFSGINDFSLFNKDKIPTHFSFQAACLIEQYYLACVCDNFNIDVKYLFDNYPPSEKEAYRLGFTHVWGDKDNPKIQRDILKLVQKYNL